MIIQTKKFLKAEDLKQDDIIMIMDEGIDVTSKVIKDKNGNFKVQQQFTVTLGNGEEKTLGMNITSQRALAVGFGKDTADWIGKSAKVNLVMTTLGKKAIMLEPLVDVE